MKKLKIEIYESPVSDKVIATFNNLEDLFKYQNVNGIFADQVSINGMTLLGWDEVSEFM